MPPQGRLHAQVQQQPGLSRHQDRHRHEQQLRQEGQKEEEEEEIVG